MDNLVNKAFESIDLNDQFVLLGVLLAPEKGAETRRKIINKSGAIVDDLKEKFNGLVDKSAAKAENIRQEADELISKAKPKFGEPKQEFGNTSM